MSGAASSAGALFEPRREHARFCSARCRTAWNRDKLGDRASGVTALGWSVTAMRDTADLLAAMQARHGARAFAVIGEMVWWVTIVDATLVRYHPDAYDGLLTGKVPARRRLIEGTLGGLRFVRNRMRGDAGCGDLVHPMPGGKDDLVAAWTWRPVPEPRLESLRPRGRAWEMSRYQAYLAHLAGRAIGETIGVATTFLESAADEASAASPGARAPVRDGNRRYADA